MHHTLRNCITVLLLALAVPAVAAPPFQQPMLLTSAGGSADGNLAGVLLQRLGIEYTANHNAKAEDLEGFQTLVLVPGFSSKGLGSAGISREQEMERVSGLLKMAEEKGIAVLTLHLGGKARRGAQSDDFNRIAAEAADLLIVVEQGDEDGFFTTIAESGEIPMHKVPAIAGAMEPLGEAIAK